MSATPITPWGPGGRRFKSCLPDSRKACKSAVSLSARNAPEARMDVYWTTNFGRPCSRWAPETLSRGPTGDRPRRRSSNSRPECGSLNDAGRRLD